MTRLVFITLFALGACATAPAADFANGPIAPLGEVANLPGVTVRPLAVIEDSRCPAAVQCVWAGRLRIDALIGLRGGSEELRREMTLGEPVMLPEGKLTLVEARPGKSADKPVPPGAYRFTFRPDP